MKIVSPLPHRRGRLEIIPLIDIMFFLLAAFMMVSIGKIHLKSLKVSLPTNVPAAQKEPKEDFINVSVNTDGQVQLDKELIPSKDALLTRLQALYATNHDQKFLITADREAHHGDIMDVLGRLRAAGFQKVAFGVMPQNSGPVGADPVAPTSALLPTPAAAPSPVTPAEATAPAALSAPAPSPDIPAPATPSTPAPTASSPAPAAPQSQPETQAASPAPAIPATPAASPAAAPATPTGN